MGKECVCRSTHGVILVSEIKILNANLFKMVEES